MFPYNVKKYVGPSSLRGNGVAATRPMVLAASQVRKALMLCIDKDGPVKVINLSGCQQLT